LPLIFFFTPPAMTFATENNGDSLAPLRWKNRVIVYWLPDRNDQRTVAGLIAAQEEGIKERELVFISTASGEVLPKHLHLDESGRSRLQTRFFSGKKPGFVLIGKDGTVKHRQDLSLDLDEMFARIDSMPMRQREMGPR